MTGSCHCGRVTAEIARRPDYMNDCNCSLCTKAGAIWGYFAAGDVSVSGAFASYTRADLPRPAVTLHFCPECGAATHWTPKAHVPQERLGVNMRLFGAEAVRGVALRFPDGAAWDGHYAFGYRRAEVVVPQQGLAGL